MLLIDELMEVCINELNGNPEYNKMNQEFMELYKQFATVISALPEEQQEICETYLNIKNLISHDIYRHLYLSKVQLPLSLRDRKDFDIFKENI